MVPIPIESNLSDVSKVNVGPRITIPCAIFSLISSLDLELNAYCAKRTAFGRSIRRKKKVKARLLDENGKQEKMNKLMKNSSQIKKRSDNSNQHTLIY